VRRFAANGEPDTQTLLAIAAILKAGGVALLPTDTVYGLHAVAADTRAVERIAAMKGRGDDKPFVVIAASTDQLAAIGCRIPEELTRVWPAPITAILARGANTQAARIPDLEWLRSLIERTGPLVSTSANRAGEPPVAEPEQLAPDLRRQLDALLDAGPLLGKPSVIVDFTGALPRILREGDPLFTQDLRKRLRISL
jgi:tRNA threonylcarbamoyl adenosine modification protein (Sua5/YciO/YrdC/YwlC family)